MKKLIAIVALAAFMASCNNGGSSKTETSTDSAMNKMNSDTSMNSMSSSSMSSSTAEGTMTMKGGKMMIMTAGKWMAMENQMTCTDSCKVMPNGQVIMKNGEKMMMTEGMTIDKDGMMMDANGKMMDMKMDDKMMMKDSMK